MNTPGPLHLKDELYPLESYLNQAIGERFLEMLRLTASGSGLNFDSAGWDTYGELDEFDRKQITPFTGIRVWAGPAIGNEVVVSATSFVEHLRLAAIEQVKASPDEQVEVERLISEIGRQLPVRTSPA